VRQISVEVGAGDPADQAARVRAGEAFSNAATAAVRQWRYQSPADPPIAFLVTARFDGEADAIATQSDGSAAAGRAVLARFTTADPGNELAEFERRLSTLREERSRAAAQFGEQDPRVLELSKQLQAMERELERTRELEKRVAVTEVRPGGAVARVTGPGATSQSPVRVGGNVRPPTKTRHVNPVYPEVAKSARVQGVVIMEVTIDEQGRVAEARVLRSIPLLDQAALDSVQQWEFTPTLLNGTPVPIVMTVTVQFSLPEAQPLF
jgi:protein TonB